METNALPNRVVPGLEDVEAQLATIDAAMDYHQSCIEALAAVRKVTADRRLPAALALAHRLPKAGYPA
jgi:hypothetical protein